jgi:hypothetical protein
MPVLIFKCTTGRQPSRRAKSSSNRAVSNWPTQQTRSSARHHGKSAGAGFVSRKIGARMPALRSVAASPGVMTARAQAPPASATRATGTLP